MFSERTGSEVMTRSRSPRRRAGKGAKENAADKSSEMWGHCCLYASRAGISHSKQEWHSMARCSLPVLPAASFCNSLSVDFTFGKISSASASIRNPAVVNLAGRVRRFRTVVPSLFSRSRNWCDRADWVTERWSAASWRLPKLRIAVSVSRCFISSMCRFFQTRLFVYAIKNK